MPGGARLIGHTAARRVILAGVWCLARRHANVLTAALFFGFRTHIFLWYAKQGAYVEELPNTNPSKTIRKRPYGSSMPLAPTDPAYHNLECRSFKASMFQICISLESKGLLENRPNQLLTTQNVTVCRDRRLDVPHI